MFKIKKKKMVVFLSMTLVILFMLLILCDNDTMALSSDTKTVLSKDFIISSERYLSNIEVTEIDKVIEKEKAETTMDTNEEEEAPVSEDVSKEIVYDGMTLDELASKLNKSMKNELSGYGYLYASYSLERGVDPYLALAISLEETGCNYNCSDLVRSCNNVGGMKGYGCGSYSYFDSLDQGIRSFIDNISNNFVAYGLTTAEEMNPKYAENPAWSNNVNNYIGIIKNNY